MPYHKLSTAKIARAAGCHPNTVRLYEQWGFLPPVPRSRSGYRLYSPEHLAQMILARTALHGDWPGRAVRQSAAGLVKQAATGDLGGALEMAYRHLALVQAELAQAEAAVLLVERWAQGVPADSTSRTQHIRDAAALLNITCDALRNWEVNGLVAVPRDPRNGYRLYGQAELARLRVIRMLRSAGYSCTAILRMLTRLEEGAAEDVRAALDTPDADEEIFSAADRWISTLREQENRAHQMIALLEERLQHP